MDEYESGRLYSMAAGLTFLYGLFISGYLINCAGVKTSLLFGSLLLTTSRLLFTLADDKIYVYILFSTTIPLGMSLCKYIYSTDM